MTGARCKAWVLPWAEGIQAAIGEHEMVHIIPEWVRLLSIPRCHAHCHKVFVWQGQLIPVFEPQVWLGTRVGAGMDLAQDSMPIICIVACENDQGSTVYGGILLSALPFRTEVSDDMQCNFPNDNIQWSAIAVSCFSADGGPAPVLDLPRIFCAPLSDLQQCGRGL